MRRTENLACLRRYRREQLPGFGQPRTQLTNSPAPLVIVLNFCWSLARGATRLQGYHLSLKQMTQFNADLVDAIIIH